MLQVEQTEFLHSDVIGLAPAEQQRAAASVAGMLTLDAQYADYNKLQVGAAEDWECMWV